MEFTSEDVERAVSQFYQSAAPAQSQEHVWLEKAKNSQEAWVFVWELLQPQKVTNYLTNFPFLKLRLQKYSSSQVLATT